MCTCVCKCAIDAVSKLATSFGGFFAGRQNREGVPFRAGLHARQEDHFLLHGHRFSKTRNHLAEGWDRDVSSQIFPGRLIHWI